MMMKKIYGLAWILLIGAFLMTAFGNALDAGSALIFSLMVLGLVFALALWSVFMSAGKTRTE